MVAHKHPNQGPKADRLDAVQVDGRWMVKFNGLRFIVIELTPFQMGTNYEIVTAGWWNILNWDTKESEKFTDELGYGKEAVFNYIEEKYG